MINLELTEKQFVELINIVDTYRDLQNEIYDSPNPNTLFTESQREMFSLMEDIYNQNF